MDIKHAVHASELKNIPELDLKRSMRRNNNTRCQQKTVPAFCAQLLCPFNMSVCCTAILLNVPSDTHTLCVYQLGNVFLITYSCFQVLKPDYVLLQHLCRSVPLKEKQENDQLNSWPLQTERRRRAYGG